MPSEETIKPTPENKTGDEIENEGKFGSNEKIEKELTPENVQYYIEQGKPIDVKVKGSTGENEEGWFVSKVDLAAGLARVFRPGENGEKPQEKKVPLEDLEKWNE